MKPKENPRQSYNVLCAKMKEASPDGTMSWFDLARWLNEQGCVPPPAPVSGMTAGI